MRRAFLLVPAAFVFLSGEALAGSVEGGLTVEGAPPIVPSKACALVVRDVYDGRSDEIAVVLTKEPVDAGKVAAALNPGTALLNEGPVLGGERILIYLRENGGVSFNARREALGKQYVGSTEMQPIEVRLTARTPARVAGRVFMAAPAKLADGGAMTLDVTFDAEIARPPAGTPLPAGGGEPGRALSAFLDALARKDWPALSAAMTPRLAGVAVTDPGSTEKGRLADAVRHFGLVLPKKNARITRGTLRADGAILEVEGEQRPGREGVFFSRMVKGPGGWLLDESAAIGLVAK